jgi:hypothetical protein
MILKPPDGLGVVTLLIRIQQHWSLLNAHDEANEEIWKTIHDLSGASE